MHEIAAEKLGVPQGKLCFRCPEIFAMAGFYLFCTQKIKLRIFTFTQ